MSRRLRIVITNLIAVNGGDASIFFGTQKILQDTFGADVSITAYGSLTAACSRCYPEIEFRQMCTLELGHGRKQRINRCLVFLAALLVKYNLVWLAKCCVTKGQLTQLLDYRSCDLIISCGGTYLVEHYDLRNRIFDYELCLLLGRGLVFFTQSLGPFSNFKQRKSLAKIFQRSLLVCVRDQKSFDHVLQLGVDAGKICLAGDAAFALVGDSVCGRLRPAWNSSPGTLKIAISVREWRHFVSVDQSRGMTAYKAAIVGLVQHLVGQYSAQVLFISTCQGIPEYWADDSRIAREIVDLLAEESKQNVRVDCSFHHPRELQNILTDYDLVVATRMHMAVLALTAGVPVLPIAYEFKMSELFKRLGWDGHCLDIETIDSNSLIVRCEALLRELAAVKAQLPDQTARLKLEAYTAGKAVSESWRRMGKSTIVEVC